MIIFENVGRTDILAHFLLLYTKKSFLQKIHFPLFHYHPPLQQLPKTTKFQISADFCIFAEIAFLGERHFSALSPLRDLCHLCRSTPRPLTGVRSLFFSCVLHLTKRRRVCPTCFFHSSRYGIRISDLVFDHALRVTPDGRVECRRKGLSDPEIRNCETGIAFLDYRAVLSRNGYTGRLGPNLRFGVTEQWNNGMMTEIQLNDLAACSAWLVDNAAGPYTPTLQCLKPAEGGSGRGEPRKTFAKNKKPNVSSTEGP